MSGPIHSQGNSQYINKNRMAQPDGALDNRTTL
jgi:hypothetical protein